MFVCLLTGAYDGDNVCEWEAVPGSAVCGTRRVQQGRYSSQSRQVVNQIHKSIVKADE